MNQTDNIKRPKISEEVITGWQQTVDVIARLAQVPAALIMKAEPPYMKVLIASKGEDNPYQPGDKDDMDGLYCEHVIKTGESLNIPNALLDEDWNDNPDIELGMISYFGLPLYWPDGQVFGTICILDTSERHFSQDIIDLIARFKDAVEHHLKMLVQQADIEEMKDSLLERAKELTCLVEISEFLIDRDMKLEDILLEVTKLLPGYFSCPEKTWVAVKYKSDYYPAERTPATGDTFHVEINCENTDEAWIEAGIDKLADENIKILDEEKSLLKAVANQLASIIELKEKEKALVSVRNQLFTTLYSIGDGVIVTDLDGKITFMNSIAEDLTGWEYGQAENLPVEKVFKIVSAKTGEKVENPVNQVLEKGVIVGLANDTTLIARDETTYQIADTAAPIRDHQEGITGTILVFSDVTAEYNYKQELENSKQELTYKQQWISSLFKNSNDAIARLDANHKIQAINQKFTELFGFNLAEVKGLDLDDVLDRPGEKVADRRKTASFLAGNQVEFEGVRYSKDNEKKVCLIRGIPVEIDGQMVGGYAQYIDITAIKHQEEKLKYTSIHDSLTGLNNRFYLEKELSNYARFEEHPISIIMLDLDGLKLINDSYGHRTGDLFLIEFSKKLEAEFSELATVGRWGGDEFLVIVPELAREEVEKLAVKITEEELEIGLSDSDNPFVSVAFGIGTKTNPNQDIFDTLHEAENNMYRDKLLKEKSTKSRLVRLLLSALHEKSQETESHAVRMADLATALGRRVGLSANELDGLAVLAQFHDIGKIMIPNRILNKPGSLNKEEWELIKRHPISGYRICSSIEDFSHIAEEVLSHHERWDGKGYPRGIAGEEIPILARIISIVDAFDVMTNGRPYKEPLTESEAIAEIQACAGTQFDPELAEKFVQMSADVEFDANNADKSLPDNFNQSGSGKSEQAAPGNQNESVSADSDTT